MITPFNSGDMRHRISLAAPLDVTTDGNITEGYNTTVTSWWAAIDPIRGDEFQHAERPASTLFYRVRMRWFDGLTAQHRITWGSKTLNIDGEPKDLGGVNRFHEMICVEAG
jgi:SPP1 family predicted phage head-tail adaptor